MRTPAGDASVEDPQAPEEVLDECILGMGAVLAGQVQEPRSLVAGVPAKVVRALTRAALILQGFRVV